MFVVTLSEILGFVLIALMILVWALWMAWRMVAVLMRRRAEPWNRSWQRKPGERATPQGRPAAAPDGAPDGPEGPEDGNR